MIKLFFKDFRKKYGPWWGRFTSTIAATVCGITITFGLTYWKTMKEKEKLLRTSEVWAMYSVRENINRANGNIADLHAAMDVINTVMDAYAKDSLENCGDSILGEFVSVFLNVSISTDDKMEELLFRNLELTKEVDDIRKISEIHDVFLLSRLMNDVSNEAASAIVEIGEKHLSHSLNKEGYFAGVHEVVNSVLGDKEVHYYFKYILPIKLGGMDEVQNLVKKKFQQEMKMLDITNKDLEEFESSLFEDKNIQVVVGGN